MSKGKSQKIKHLLRVNIFYDKKKKKYCGSQSGCRDNWLGVPQNLCCSPQFKQPKELAYLIITFYSIDFKKSQNENVQTKINKQKNTDIFHNFFNMY